MIIVIQLRLAIVQGRPQPPSTITFLASLGEYSCESLAETIHSMSCIVCTLQDQPLSQVCGEVLIRKSNMDNIICDISFCSRFICLSTPSIRLRLWSATISLLPYPCNSIDSFETLRRSKVVANLSLISAFRTSVLVWRCWLVMPQFRRSQMRFYEFTTIATTYRTSVVRPAWVLGRLFQDPDDIMPSTLSGM